MFQWAKNSSGHFLEPNTYMKSFTCLKGPAYTRRHVKVDFYPAAVWLAECFFLSQCGIDLLGSPEYPRQKRTWRERGREKNESLVQRAYPICLSSWITGESHCSKYSLSKCSLSQWMDFYGNKWKAPEASSYSVALLPLLLIKARKA